MKRILLSLLYTALVAPLGFSQASSIQDLEAAIRKECSRSPGTFAVAFRELERPGRTLLIQEKEPFHAASTMKTPVMAEVYRQAKAGKFRMEDSLVVKNEFKSIVDGSPFSLNIGDDSEEALYGKIGQKAAIYDLVYDMIIYSSNLATNIVIELVDAREVTRMLRTLGIMNMQVLRGVEDTKAFQQGKNNTTTAYDLMLLFEQIAKGKPAGKKASKAMMDILLDQKFKDAIPAKLPADVKVAHKTGWITRVRHDSGIVFLPDGRRYVLVLLSKQWESDELATEIMANVSRMIYDFTTNTPQ
jgi:beta-lactamase class A